MVSGGFFVGGNIDIFRKMLYIINMGIEELSNYIIIDQGIRFGKPCIRGTRITDSAYGDSHNIVNLRDFTTEVTEFHGEKGKKQLKTPCFSAYSVVFILKFMML